MVALTFFVGSIFFTIGGGLQSWLAFPGAISKRPPGGARSSSRPGPCSSTSRPSRRSTRRFANPEYDRLVWRPDALGSVCFLVSGVIAYRAARRHGWQPLVNLLGCIFFGIAAVAGYVVPSSGSVLELAAANWSTCLGAACFLACAVGALRVN